MKDNRHPTHEVEVNNFRLKLRNSFLKKKKCLMMAKEQERVIKWTDQMNDIK